jgi:mannose-1-phosphate guanylyltransferase
VTSYGTRVSFIWGAKAIIDAFHRYLPEMAEVFDDIKAKLGTSEEKEAILGAYSQCKNISIDYGVMEKLRTFMFALERLRGPILDPGRLFTRSQEKDENNNVINANAQTYETRNCIIKGSPDKLIVVQGLNWLSHRRIRKRRDRL